MKVEMKVETHCKLYYSAIGMKHNRRLWHDNKTNYSDKQNNVSCQQSKKTWMNSQHKQLRLHVGDREAVCECFSVNMLYCSYAYTTINKNNLMTKEKKWVIKVWKLLVKQTTWPRWRTETSRSRSSCFNRRSNLLSFAPSCIPEAESSRVTHRPCSLPTHLKLIADYLCVVCCHSQVS